MSCHESAMTHAEPLHPPGPHPPGPMKAPRGHSGRVGEQPVTAQSDLLLFVRRCRDLGRGRGRGGVLQSYPIFSNMQSDDDASLQSEASHLQVPPLLLLVAPTDRPACMLHASWHLTRRHMCRTAQHCRSSTGTEWTALNNHGSEVCTSVWVL